MNKYGAKRTEADGIIFDSQREARRWMELRLLERAGQITRLERQVTYPLEVNGKLICRYRADFRYFENGEPVVEDSKGVRTPVYKIKKALMAAIHGVEVRET